ncbi:MAG: acetylglutamate kinase [Bacteroidota bacterium]
MKTPLHIVKIGGNVINDPEKLTVFLKDFAALPEQKILVHGGGKRASELNQKLGIPVQMVEGRRITSAKDLEVVVMVYAGLLNKQIVAKLTAEGCPALGLSGADGGSILAVKRKPKPIDFGFVGDVTSVNTELIIHQLSGGLTPVFCALTHDQNGQLLNTNADTIAAQLTIALADYYEVALSYCFEKKGVLRDLKDENSVISSIDRMQYEQLKIENIIHEGMLPKLQNCFDALEKGVTQVRVGTVEMISDKEIIHTQLIL